MADEEWDANKEAEQLWDQDGEFSVHDLALFLAEAYAAGKASVLDELNKLQSWQRIDMTYKAPEQLTPELVAGYLEMIHLKCIELRRRIKERP